MSATLTTPVVAYRCWNYEYERPRRMGWPTLVKTGYEPIGRAPSRITPRKITVQVRQYDGAAPVLSSVSVSGTWTRTGRAVTQEQIRHDARPGLAFTIYPPDWVMELAADAVARASEEVSR